MDTGTGATDAEVLPEPVATNVEYWDRQAPRYASWFLRKREGVRSTS